MVTQPSDQIARRPARSSTNQAHDVCTTVSDQEGQGYQRGNPAEILHQEYLCVCVWKSGWWSCGLTMPFSELRTGLSKAGNDPEDTPDRHSRNSDEDIGRLAEVKAGRY